MHCQQVKTQAFETIENELIIPINQLSSQSNRLAVIVMVENK